MREVPEEMKPRRIEISAGNDNQRLRAQKRPEQAHPLKSVRGAAARRGRVPTWTMTWLSKI